MTLQSPTDMIQLPLTLAERNRVIKTMREMFNGVNDPNKLDEATQNAGIPAFLLNVYLATVADLSPMGLGTVVYIPVQIATREGGRKSIYFLDPGEEELVGIYVTSEGLALKFMKRESGDGVPARVEDVYSTRITNRAGELIFACKERLWRFNPETGQGNFSPISGTEHSSVLVEAAQTSTVSFFWSAIAYQPNAW